MTKYYKIIDRSLLFRAEMAIPYECVEIFTSNICIAVGTSRDVNLIWDNRKYKATVSHINNTSAKPTYLFWCHERNSFITDIRKEFVQSFIAYESQMYDDIKANKNSKYKRKTLLGGNQEVLIFENVGIDNIKLKTYIKVNTPYDELFKRLIDSNVFYWLGNEENKRLITNISAWYHINDLGQHVDKVHVVYYLVDDVKKQIYIGSANNRLGDRVKPGRHEIPGWNRFMYEEVHPECNNIKDFEYHSINTFTKFFKNLGRLDTLGLSEYSLVNKDFGKYR